MFRLQPYIEYFECKTSLNLIQVDNYGFRQNQIVPGLSYLTEERICFSNEELLRNDFSLSCTFKDFLFYEV
jgi:hypothetical protein